MRVSSTFALHQVTIAMKDFACQERKQLIVKNKLLPWSAHAAETLSLDMFRILYSFNLTDAQVKSPTVDPSRSWNNLFVSQDTCMPLLSQFWMFFPLSFVMLMMKMF